MIPAGAAVLITLVGASSAQPIYERFRLDAPNGTDGADVGWSVSIGTSTIAVGAPRADLGGLAASGAVYLFDPATGAFDRTIEPNTPSNQRQFGFAVAIAGTTLAVGSPSGGTRDGAIWLFDLATQTQIRRIDIPKSQFGADAWSLALSDQYILIGNLNGGTPTITGTAGLYDAATGTFIRTFAPPASAEFSGFGQSVAIDGDIAIIGAPGDTDAGLNAGAAWIYNLASGTLRRKIVPAGITPDARIGSSVAVQGDLLVMGGPRDDTDGNRAGVAFIYDIDGNFVARLAPPDPGDNVEFGTSVAIDGERIVIGGRTSTDNAAPGTAVLFDIEGNFLEDLIPFGNIQNERFGFSADLAGNRIVLGAPETLATLNDASSDRTGAAYIFDFADTDGDGLLDHWETNGIDINRDGTVDLDLSNLGADPMKKNLYCEIDVHSDASLTQATLDKIEAAFANAPVMNPDGTTGITLLMERDEADLTPRNYALNVMTGSDTLRPGIAAQRTANFGTAAQRSSSNAANILAAKRLAYRYGVFGGTLTFTNAMGTSSTPSGYSELPGDDFVVTMKGFTVRTDDETRTVMHEFGHSLGLRHGGGDDANYKPNFFSVMNYMFQFDSAWSAGWSSSLALDYSRAALPAVNEASLDEATGIGSDDASSNGRLFTFTNTSPGAAGTGFTLFIGSGAIGDGVDFNLDGDFGDTGLPISLNDNGAAGGTLESLDGHDDWSSLHFPLRGAPDFANGAVGVGEDTLSDGSPGAYTLEDQIRDESTEALDLAGPAPCNPADLTQPFGVTDLDDVDAFINAFVASEPLADLVPPAGVVDLQDVDAFITAFLAGCP